MLLLAKRWCHWWFSPYSLCIHSYHRHLLHDNSLIWIRDVVDSAVSGCQRRGRLSSVVVVCCLLPLPLLLANPKRSLLLHWKYQSSGAATNVNIEFKCYSRCDCWSATLWLTIVSCGEGGGGGRRLRLYDNCESIQQSNYSQVQRSHSSAGHSLP